MRNRAKCKLCGDIVESFHNQDLVVCSCGEISVDGGEALKCSAKHWENFLRIDDEGREIAVKVESEPKTLPELGEIPPKPSRAELFKEVMQMIEAYERLPQQALAQPCTTYDLLSVLLLLAASLRAES